MSHTYEFPSKSSPTSPPHEVYVAEDGSISCSCPGYHHRGECWHVREVKSLKHTPETCNDGGCSLRQAEYNELKAQMMEEQE